MLLFLRMCTEISILVFVTAISSIYISEYFLRTYSLGDIYLSLMFVSYGSYLFGMRHISTSHKEVIDILGSLGSSSSPRWLFSSPGLVLSAMGIHLFAFSAYIIVLMKYLLNL